MMVLLWKIILNYNFIIISHHHLSAKLSVISTLKQRAKTVCFNNQLLKEEEDHLRHAIKKCKYPVRALNRASIKQKKTNRTNQDSHISRNNTGFNNNKPYMLVAYVKGISESCKNTCKKNGIEMHFKGGNTIKDLWVHPKDKETPSSRKVG